MLKILRGLDTDGKGRPGGGLDGFERETATECKLEENSQTLASRKGKAAQLKATPGRKAKC